MKKYKEFVEISSNKFNYLYVFMLVILVSYLIFSLISININNNILLILLPYINTLVIFITLFIFKLTLKYKYNISFLIICILITYITLPLFLHIDTTYINPYQYATNYFNKIQNLDFISVILINVNILFVPYILNKIVKDKSTFLYENDIIKLIEKTDTYINCFNSHSELEDFITILNDSEINNVIPLNKFKEITKVNSKTNFYITMQIIHFKNSDVIKVKFHQKSNFLKLKKLNIYNKAILLGD